MIALITNGYLKRLSHWRRFLFLSNKMTDSAYTYNVECSKEKKIKADRHFTHTDSLQHYIHTHAHTEFCGKSVTNLSNWDGKANMYMTNARDDSIDHIVRLFFGRREKRWEYTQYGETTSFSKTQNSITQIWKRKSNVADEGQIMFEIQPFSMTSWEIIVGLRDYAGGLYAAFGVCLLFSKFVVCCLFESMCKPKMQPSHPWGHPIFVFVFFFLLN